MERPRPDIFEGKDFLLEKENFLVTKDTLSFLARLGNKTLKTIEEIGNIFILLYSTLRNTFRPPLEIHPLIQQLYSIGVESLPVVLLTGTLTGMVFTIQTTYMLQIFSAEGMIGGIVSGGAVKELAPIIAAFALSGRIGASFTAELATMKVTEQIDAMRVMGTDPIKYLVVPRFLACTFMLPVLTIFAVFLSIVGGGLTVVFVFHMNAYFFLEKVKSSLFTNDLFITIFKTLVFGMVIAIVGCYRGLSTLQTSGAEGVGIATTGTVVQSIITILIFDFLLNHLFYLVLGLGAE